MIDPDVSDRIETLDALDYQEADDITFYYLQDLNVGETAISATVTSEVTAGIDPTPLLLLTGSANINAVDGIVVQRVTGRVPNVVYKLRCRITLSSGRVLVKSAYLPVVRY